MRRDTKQHPNLSVWNEEEFETLAMKEEQLPETYRSPSIPIEECSLRVVDGPHKGEELKLESDIYHIGRADWCDLCLVQDKWVSGHHCIIYVGTDGVQVRDKGSRNGIFLGGHRVFDALLTPGSLLRVGESVLEVYSTHTQKELSIKYYDASKKLVGRSERMRQLFSMLPRLARRNVPILFTGETGTGKTTFAKILHEQSPRKHKPFVSVNCGALPASLIESELFGHEKGAFTGATKQTKGYFEQADGGTLFLDEIGDMPIHTQSKILRTLQSGEFSRVGGNENLTADVRILAATNKDLEECVKNGEFREDLFYRLNVVRVHIPPLRQRREDIKLLADFFLKRNAELKKAPKLRLSSESVELLESHNWPGNVRELENTLYRASLLATADVLLPKDIPLGIIEQGEELDSKNKESSIKDFISILKKASGKNPFIPWVESEFAKASYLEHEKDLDLTAKFLGITLERLEEILAKN